MKIEATFASWRDAARKLLAAGVPPEQVRFDDGSHGLLWTDGVTTNPVATNAHSLKLPRRFLDRATHAAAHSDAHRWDLLYRVAWRLVHENRALLDVEIDDDVRELARLDRDVRRDLHRMHAFVRFREVDDHFVAWYAPDHDILAPAAPFFRDRFASMRWSILTPRGSLHWDLQSLQFGDGVSRLDAPSGDELESLWRTYYASIFNPARVNLKAMRADMPSRVWSAMPELAEVPRLVLAAAPRVGGMLEMQRSAPTAAPFVPAAEGTSLDVLRLAASGCQGCDLHLRATQTVFGEGNPNAEIVLVGEQPGDSEDRAGRPFIGPAGEVLDRALGEAGIKRDAVYITNAVKHFAWTERGKQRIHRTPRGIEVTACRPWLDAELRAIAPRLVVALGSTAARALLGAEFRLTAGRGTVIRTRTGLDVLATWHPSAILRSTSGEQLFAQLAADLRCAEDYRARKLR